MKEKIESLRLETETAMAQTETGRGLYELKVKFQTALKGIMSGMKDLAKESDPKHAHNLVLEWFHENCPNYGKVPKFNADHKVIAKNAA